MSSSKESLAQLLATLPYSSPFLFVDEILEVDENKIRGKYLYRKDEYFYQGHFRDRPVTPGVILTETMAQIGLVALGIYLANQSGNPSPPPFAFTSADVNFSKMVLPGEEVTVEGEKIYFRLGKIKVNTVMYNKAGEKVCSGVLSGMILKRKTT